jgi:hypothetical protein
MRAPRLVVVAVLAGTFATIGTGCGGGGASSEEKWADDVCGRIADWQDDLVKIADDVGTQLQTPDAASAQTIRTGVEDGVEATQDLVGDLRGIDAPDTEGGSEAKQELDDLSSQLDTTAERAKTALDRVPESATAAELIGAVSGVLGNLQSLIAQARSALQAIQRKGADLRTGFEQADACDDLQASTS